MRAYLQRLIAWIKGALAQLRLFKFPNATIFGQPTIQDGQVSNFSATNYLQFPFLVDFAGRPWQIDCAFTTGADVSQQHNIFDSAFGLAFAFANGHFVMALSTNGTTWDLGAPEGTHRILPNTTYYVRIAWDGSQYTLSFSIDKETYTTDIVVNSSVTLAPKQIVIGKSILNPSAIFNGSINMNHAMLTISGKVVWQGMDDAGLATRLAIDLSNIDAAGKLRLNNVAMEGEVGQKLNDLSKDVANGVHPGAVSGLALNLMPKANTTEQEFVRQITGGSYAASVWDGGVAKIERIKGNTIVVDGQLINMRADGIRSTNADGTSSEERKWTTHLFEDGMKSAGEAYDEKTATKEVKRINSIDLGTLRWSMTSGVFLSSSISDRVAGITNLQCAKYAVVRKGYNNLLDKEMCGAGGNNNIFIKDADYNNVTDFKNSLNGVLLYYETTDIGEFEYDELNLTYTAHKNGEEEAIVPEGFESSPLKADITYGVDAYGAIINLLDRVAALEGNTASLTSALTAAQSLTSEEGE